MEYAMVGIIAIIILLIINHDIIFIRKTKNLPISRKAYRVFIFSLLVYLLSDVLWGIFEEYAPYQVLYANTVLFFLTMSFSVFLWARYVTLYINIKSFLHRVLYYVGLIVFIAVVAMLVVNFFNPIIFDVDENGYNPNTGRYVIFFVQELMYFITAIVSLVEFLYEKRRMYKNRFVVICLYCTAMAVSIFLQMSFWDLPMYSMGCMIGICLIHSFIVESEKEESRKQLEEMLDREIRHEKELDTTKALVNVDSLTGAQSKFAYAKMEDEIDKLIAANLIKEFAVVVFDINGLKYINDTYGHEAGDKYIKDCYKIITDVYKDNLVYRFGGDEFVVLLQDEYYKKRDELLFKFETIIDDNLQKNLPVVSTGMSLFDLDVDNTYRAVFVRADDRMYTRKKILKSRGSHGR